MAAKVEIIIRVKNSEAKRPLKETEEGLEGIGEKADGAGKKVKSFGEVATGALRRVGELAVDSLVDAGMAIAGFVADSVSAAGDYEQSMNIMQATTEATDEQMAAVQKTAQALGADLTLPATSAADAGTAMLELAKAGLTVEEAMAAAQGTLQLAAAGQLEEARAAEITANALNAFGLAGTDAVFVADMLAATANASSMEVSDMADALKQGAGIFAAFQAPVVGSKQAITDFSTAVGIMAEAGIKGSSAGTFLAQGLSQLTGPSEKAKGLMGDLADRIGLAGDLAFDSAGKMRSLPEIIDILSRSTADMSDEMRGYYLTTILGQEGMKAFLPLMKAGTAGWKEMQTAVTRQNAAAEMAASRMEGLKGAAAGFGSQLETLMLEGLIPLLPLMAAGISKAAEFAGSFVGQVGPAVESAITFITRAADVVQAIFLPAVAGATAALVAYALVQTAQAIPALIAMIPTIAASVVAFQAQALAVGLAVLPYVALAAAAAVVTLKFQEFNQSIQNSTQTLLESRQWWTDSATAITSYGAAVGEAKDRLAPYATEIQNVRAAIEAETSALAARMTLNPEGDYTSEMAHINALVEVLQRSTASYNAEEQALLRTAAASQTGTAQLAAMDAAQTTSQATTQLTVEELTKLADQLQETYQKGTEAVGAYVETELGFLESLNKAREEGFNEQFEQQAVAYARQQAAQAAHLGQMLQDYTLAQVQLGNISKEQGEVVIGAIEKQFGVVEDSNARVFLAMTSQIDAFAASGSSDLNALSNDLGGLADDAVETRARMTELERQYTAELIHNFDPSKQSAADLARQLRAIPAKVYSEVMVKTIRVEENRSGPSSSRPGEGMEKRATGGPVTKGVPYRVGERGEEEFVPNQSGTIIPNDKLGQGGGTTNILNYYASSGTSPESDVAQALRMQTILQGG